jgi:hypothetical protein
MNKGFAFDLGEWFSTNKIQVRANLSTYFGGRPGEEFSGRWFEKFVGMGDPNRFDPADVLAVEALSVKVAPESAAKLLITEAARFNDLLQRIPSDRDMWQVDGSIFDSGSAAQNLHTALDDLWGIGGVIAGKLMAAKRPRLIPILDSGVERVLKPAKGRFWGTMYDQISDQGRRQKIAEVCATAPSEVSLLRRIDVALWMHATHNKRTG